MNEALFGATNEPLGTSFRSRHVKKEYIYAGKTGTSQIRKITKEESLKQKLKEAGLVSYTLTQIWNKQGKFRLGHYWAYKDEKAFVSCQKIINDSADYDWKVCSEALLCVKILVRDPNMASVIGSNTGLVKNIVAKLPSKPSLKM